MTEQEARAIERNLSELLPGCKLEAYGTTDANYQTQTFDQIWRVAVYSSEEPGSTLICVIRNQAHAEALLDMCHTYHNQLLGNEYVYPKGKAFTDQNGETVIQGGVYGINEQGDLYDLEPVKHFRPSEY